MAIQMIEHEGKMIPAKFENGKWIPDLDKILKYTADGIKVVDKKDEK